MLGLHNIFLIAPPHPSSSSFIYSSHQIPNLGNNDQQESCFPRKEYSLNLGEDFDASSKVCKDCGNRAKKECEFRRCRTCCKSRAFNCATHVKSTWIPASRRKELRRRGGDDGVGSRETSGSSSGGGGNKRLRENLTTPSNSFSNSDNNAAAAAFNLDSSSHYRDASFKQSLPSQVQAPAVFRFIRVTAMDGGEAEVAYQAMVNISGHVFKGFLYNQGIDEKNIYPCISKIPSDSCARNEDSTSPILDPPDSYPASASQRLLKIASTR